MGMHNAQDPARDCGALGERVDILFNFTKLQTRIILINNYTHSRNDGSIALYNDIVYAVFRT